MNGFLDDIYLRPSCYECKFNEIPKVYVDFTIADFGGVNKVEKGLNDGKGTSLVLIHTKHGKELWDLLKDGYKSQEVKFEDTIKRNKPLVESACKNCKRNYFFEDFKNKGLQYVEKKYMSARVWTWHKGINLIEKNS